MFTRLDYSSALKYSIIMRYTNIVYCILLLLYVILLGPQNKGRGHNEAIKKMAQLCQNFSGQKFIQEMVIYNIL